MPSLQDICGDHRGRANQLEGTFPLNSIDLLAKTVFRVPLKEAIRLYKRSDTFRHVLFATAELDDPIEPAIPFIRHDLLPILEREWCFKRDCVPDYMRVHVGRAARERVIEGLRSDYNLEPAERFSRLKKSLGAEAVEPSDPDTWEHDVYSCLLLVPAELSGADAPFCWLGGRAEALTRYRDWFFDPRVTVLHGAEAVKAARTVLKEGT
jgi:hypothetical protein